MPSRHCENAPPWSGAPILESPFRSPSPGCMVWRELLNFPRASLSSRLQWGHWCHSPDAMLATEAFSMWTVVRGVPLQCRAQARSGVSLLTGMAERPG